MLNVSGLSVEYSGGAKAIDSVSFAIAAGESVALIGANGAGKTTLLLALVGVLAASSGSVEASGLQLSKKNLREIRSRIGMVFQNPDDQLFMPSIFEDVAFGLRSYGFSEAEVGKRIDETLGLLGIAHLADRSPLKLSGGEKRLAAIATVLAMGPGLIMFDEPTAFLDPRARRGLAAAISGMPQGKLIATHDLGFAGTACSRVLLLQGGRLVADEGTSLLANTAMLESAGL